MKHVADKGRARTASRLFMTRALSHTHPRERPHTFAQNRDQFSKSTNSAVSVCELDEIYAQKSHRPLHTGRRPSDFFRTSPGTRPAIADRATNRSQRLARCTARLGHVIRSTRRVAALDAVPFVTTVPCVLLLLRAACRGVLQLCVSQRLGPDATDVQLPAQSCDSNRCRCCLGRRNCTL